MPTINRFWVGKPIPPAYVDFGAAWEKLNPGYEVVTWGWEALDEFPDLKPVFDDMFTRDAGRNGIELFVQIADVVGYAMVEKFGGIYVNCDIQPVKPLHLVYGAWASFENDTDGRVVNAAIGSDVPHDVFWRGLLDGLPERYFSRPGAEMVEATGPAYLTDYYHEHLQELTVFPKDTFNPVHWSQVEFGGDAAQWLDSLPAESIAVHHWGHKRLNAEGKARSNRIEDATQF